MKLDWFAIYWPADVPRIKAMVLDEVMSIYVYQAKFY